MTTHPVAHLYDTLRTLPGAAAPADTLDSLHRALVEAVDSVSTQELDETCGELCDMADTWWNEGHRDAALLLWQVLAQLDSHRDFIGTYVEQARRRLETHERPGPPSLQAQHRRRMAELGPTAVLRDELRVLLARQDSGQATGERHAEIIRRLESLQQLTSLTRKELRLLRSLRG